MPFYGPWGSGGGMGRDEAIKRAAVARKRGQNAARTANRIRLARKRAALLGEWWKPEKAA